ncbi:Glutamate synthase [NADPH] large chain [hydrothermal vent metagenome]|uniref:Glutamate synthase [NADPH] large chain n=1 Tax=hydrothermal vent metagenome TaxID=652676 RepID=A0A3B1CQG6_9ZZZZ
MKLNEDFTTRSKIGDLGRWYATEFVKGVSEGLSHGEFILDAGAGECVYRRFFQHCKYISVDLAVGEERWNYTNLDCIAVLDRLPFENASFDAVLCTQVLEHLEWPRETLREFNRILKPGGRLFLTAPMSHSEHQVPYDFFRYTSFGLRSLCEYANFTQIEVRASGGGFVRMAYEFPQILSIFPRTGFGSGKLQIKGVILFPLRMATFVLVRLFQMVFLWMDRFDKIRNHPFGWSVVAKK